MLDNKIKILMNNPLVMANLVDEETMDVIISSLTDAGKEKQTYLAQLQIGVARAAAKDQEARVVRLLK